MADAMETLKGILGDDTGDKLKSLMGSLSDDNSEIADDGADYVNDMKSLIDRLGSSRSDPRANLLLSLRPYMRDERKKSIDGAVKLLNLSKLTELMRNM